MYAQALHNSTEFATPKKRSRPPRVSCLFCLLTDSCKYKIHYFFVYETLLSSESINNSWVLTWRNGNPDKINRFTKPTRKSDVSQSLGFHYTRLYRLMGWREKFRYLHMYVPINHFGIIINLQKTYLHNEKWESHSKTKKFTELAKRRGRKMLRDFIWGMIVRTCHVKKEITKWQGQI